MPDTVDTPASMGLVLAIVVLGVLLPAAGISFVVIYVMEWLGTKLNFGSRCHE